MKKPNLFNNETTKRVLVVAMLSVFFTQSTFAVEAIGAATDNIKEYWDDVSTLIKMIGAVVGLIGGLRIYNKWTNGDQDINKEILGWGGACLFLVLVPTFVSAFFEVN
ncbi:MAG: DUF4134 domain-containing protein [Bacteroidota bacterium]|nr:DUF4134 domain-containing protein [Bacteroidota bacterium]